VIFSKDQDDDWSGDGGNGNAGFPQSCVGTTVAMEKAARILTMCCQPGIGCEQPVGRLQQLGGNAGRLVAFPCSGASADSGFEAQSCWFRKLEKNAERTISKGSTMSRNWYARRFKVLPQWGERGIEQVRQEISRTSCYQSLGQCQQQEKPASVQADRDLLQRQPRKIAPPEQMPNTTPGYA